MSKSQSSTTSKPSKSLPIDSVFNDSFLFGNSSQAATTNSTRSPFKTLLTKRNAIGESVTTSSNSSSRRIIPDTYQEDSQLTQLVVEEESQVDGFNQHDFEANAESVEEDINTDGGGDTTHELPPIRGGRAPQSKNYSVVENLALVEGVRDIKAYDKNSPRWKDVCAHVTATTDVKRSETQFHDHFKVMQLCIRSALSACSAKGDAHPDPSLTDEQSMQKWLDFIHKIYLVMISDSKTYQSSKWWTPEIVSCTLRIVLLLNSQMRSQHGSGVTAGAEQIRGKLNQELEGKRALMKEQRLRDEEKENNKVQTQVRMTEVVGEMCVAIKSVTEALTAAPANQNAVIDLTNLEDQITDLKTQLSNVNGKMDLLLARMDGQQQK
jgi:hypothetical protein